MSYGDEFYHQPPGEAIECLDLLFRIVDIGERLTRLNQAAASRAIGGAALSELTAFAGARDTLQAHFDELAQGPGVQDWAAGERHAAQETIAGLPLLEGLSKPETVQGLREGAERILAIIALFPLSGDEAEPIDAQPASSAEAAHATTAATDAINPGTDDETAGGTPEEEVESLLNLREVALFARFLRHNEWLLAECKIPISFTSGWYEKLMEADEKAGPARVTVTDDELHEERKLILHSLQRLYAEDAREMLAAFCEGMDPEDPRRDFFAMLTKVTEPAHWEALADMLSGDVVDGVTYVGERSSHCRGSGYTTVGVRHAALGVLDRVTDLSTEFPTLRSAVAISLLPDNFVDALAEMAEYYTAAAPAGNGQGVLRDLLSNPRVLRAVGFSWLTTKFLQNAAQAKVIDPISKEKPLLAAGDMLRLAIFHCDSKAFQSGGKNHGRIVDALEAAETQIQVHRQANRAT